VNLTNSAVTVEIEQEAAGVDLVSRNTLETGSHELPRYAVVWLKPGRH